MTEPLCPICGFPLQRYGCKDLEQVGAFCHGPAPGDPPFGPSRPSMHGAVSFSPSQDEELRRFQTTLDAATQQEKPPMIDLEPVRIGRGEYDPYFKEHATLAEATSKVPESKKDLIFLFGETTVVLAEPLPRLDGWKLTEAGDARFVEERRCLT